MSRGFLKFMKIFISDKRTEKGMTQRQLAEICGITYQSLQRYEKGIVYPTIPIALSIARALDTTIGDLYVLEDND